MYHSSRKLIDGLHTKPTSTIEINIILLSLLFDWMFVSIILHTGLQLEKIL